MANKEIALTVDKHEGNSSSEKLLFDSVERGKEIDVSINDIDGNPVKLDGLVLKFIDVKQNGKLLIDSEKANFTMYDEDGKFRYVLPERVFNASGWCKFELWKNDQKIDTTNYFQIVIHDLIKNSGLDDSDYVSDLESLKQEYNGVISDLKSLLDNGENSINSAVNDAKSQVKELIENTQKQLQEIAKESDQANQISEQLAKLKELTDKLSATDIDGLKQEIKDISSETKQLQEKISKIDLSVFVKKDDLPNFDSFATKDEIPDTSNLAEKTDIPSVDGFAKSTEVENSIRSAKDEINKSLDTKADKTEVTEKVDQKTVDSSIEQALDPIKQEVADKADKKDIPDVTGLAAKKDIPNIDGLAKTADVKAGLDTKADKQTVTDLQKTVQTNKDNTDGNINGIKNQVGTTKSLTAVFKSNDEYNNFISSGDSDSTMMTAFKYDTDETNENFSQGYMTGVIFGQPRRNVTISAAGTTPLVEVHVHSTIQPYSNWSVQLATQQDIEQYQNKIKDMQSTIDDLVGRVSALEQKNK